MEAQGQTGYWADVDLLPTRRHSPPVNVQGYSSRQIFGERLSAFGPPRGGSSRVSPAARFRT